MSALHASSEKPISLEAFFYKVASPPIIRAEPLRPQLQRGPEHQPPPHVAPCQGAAEPRRPHGEILPRLGRLPDGIPHRA
jgi:hypothetical protein